MRSTFLTSLLVLFRLIAACSSDAEQPAQTVEPPTKGRMAHAIVAADGTGDHVSVQEAINAAPSSRKDYYYIYIKKGTYKETITVPQNKDYIYLIGEDAQTTVLTYDNYASRLKPDGSEYGTSGSASFFARGNQFVAENITFENTAGMTAGQALAINISAPHSAFRNCRFLGHQDTWYAANGTYQYLKDCYIEGSVDFIFGGSTAFFENCNIVSTRNGYLTAASTPEGQSYGYVFQACTLTAYPNVADHSVYLGRPWRPYAKVVFIGCNMGKQIQKVGWHNWGNVDNEKTAFYAEYQSQGAGADIDGRVSWSHQLTEQEAKAYTYEKVIGKKHPLFVEEEIRIKKINNI